MGLHYYCNICFDICNCRCKILYLYIRVLCGHGFLSLMIYLKNLNLSIFLLVPKSWRATLLRYDHCRFVDLSRTAAADHWISAQHYGRPTVGKEQQSCPSPSPAKLLVCEPKFCTIQAARLLPMEGALSLSGSVSSHSRIIDLRSNPFGAKTGGCGAPLNSVNSYFT